MNKYVLLLIISFLFCSCSSGQSFKSDAGKATEASTEASAEAPTESLQSYKYDFWKAVNEKNMVKAESILKNWDLADANDPELYASYFNYYTIKSMEKDSIYLNKEFAEKALEFITEGIERFPTRLDMRVAKIHMLGRLKEYNLYVFEIINAIKYSKQIDNNWKGENFLTIERPDVIFEDAVLAFQEKLLQENNPALYNGVIQISNEMLRQYPKHEQSLINISYINIRNENYDKALEAILKARDINPKSAIVLFNVAHVYNMKGDKDNAKKYYEQTITNANTDKEKALKEAAQKQLSALK